MPRGRATQGSKRGTKRSGSRSRSRAARESEWNQFRREMGKGYTMSELSALYKKRKSSGGAAAKRAAKRVQRGTTATVAAATAAKAKTTNGIRAKAQSAKLKATFLHPLDAAPSDQALHVNDVTSLDAWLEAEIPDFVPFGKHYHKEQYHFVTPEQFCAVQRRATREFYKPLYERNGWLHNKKAKFGAKNDPVFVERFIVPRPERARIALIGDLHSSLTSLLNILGRLKRDGAFSSNFTLADDHYIIFLGDIVNRGPYSIELLTLVAHLQVANPDQVRVINGNHEDCDVYTAYGLSEEFRHQFKASLPDTLAYTNYLAYLPSAIFLEMGDQTYQLCHGAITAREEEQADIKRLLKSPSARFALLFYNKKDSEECTIGKTDNFKWGDFTSKIKETRPSKRGPGVLEFGRTAVKRYLDELGITAIMSGHQDNSNLTLLTPREGYGASKFEQDPYYTDLQRPKDYASFRDGHTVTLVPGKDFLALNTSSSAYQSKREDTSLVYDVFLGLGS